MLGMAMTKMLFMELRQTIGSSIADDQIAVDSESSGQICTNTMGILLRFSNASSKISLSSKPHHRPSSRPL